MSATPVSLLDRLRVAPDDGAWRRLVDLYTPLVRDWLRRQLVPDADADDLLQEVLGTLVRELPGFRHERPGAFRAWLRGVTANRLRGYWRDRRHRPVGDVADLIEQLADPDSGLSRLWDREHNRHVARRLLDAIRPEFSAPTWQAFWRQVMDGARAAEAAAELGTSVNAVLVAKSRVLRRLREEGRGLLD